MHSPKGSSTKEYNVSSPSPDDDRSATYPVFGYLGLLSVYHNTILTTLAVIIIWYSWPKILNQLQTHPCHHHYELNQNTGARIKALEGHYHPVRAQPHGNSIL